MDSDLFVANGINIEVIWFDQDIVEVLLSASNESFSVPSNESFSGLAKYTEAPMALRNLQTPSELLNSEEGIQRVDEILTRIEHNIFS